MTTTSAATLAREMVAFDARRALAIERREYDKASLIEQEREDVAIERFALVRADWWPALRPMRPRAA